MSWEYITLDVADRIATITLNRPRQLNALVDSMRTDLEEAIAQAAAKARVLLITGAGKAFCSGGDVRYLAELRRGRRSEEVRELVRAGRKVVERLRNLSLPTLAAVNGVAAGAGLSLALACDLRLASESARFGATFSRIGLHPDWGASYFLTRLCGPAVACDLIFTGRLIDAGEALRIGMVNRVVEEKAFAEKARKQAEELAAAPPESVRWAKQAVHRTSAGASLAKILEHEEAAQLACFETEDALEGITAFEEKRSPRFRGR